MLIQMQTILWRRSLLTALLATAGLTIAGCGTDVDDGLGGAAGDETADQQLAEDTALLAALTGVYDLTGNWSGSAGDAAFLVVRPPTTDGSAAVLLYDIDDEIGNCTDRPIVGEATVDRFTDEPRVFMDGVFDFDSAILSLQVNGALRINFSDVNDIDADANTSERLDYTAPAVALMEQDIPAEC